LGKDNSQKRWTLTFDGEKLNVLGREISVDGETDG
jgi:hypothetical protein